MINGISHPEMKRLFKRIKKQQENHADTMMEESLMACELLNSSLILPIRKNEDIREVLQIPCPGGKIYLGVFTDAEEFRKGNVEMTLFTNSWEMLFKLIGCGVDGLVINVFDEAVFIGKDFLDQYFGDDGVED